MTHAFAVDRFEGKDKEIAVLVADDGRTIDVHRDLLPEGVQPGEILTLTFARDAEATRKVAEQTRAIQEELKARDPGGDIKL